MKRLLQLLSALFLAAFLAGCGTPGGGGSPMLGGYKLGSMLPNDIQTVYIPSVRNLTSEPLVEIEASRALQRELQTDGSLSIAAEGVADSILEITLKRFDLRPLVYGREDRARPDEYRAILSGSVRLVRADTGAVIIDEPYVTGDFFVPFVTDITTAKRRVLPDVSRDLAHDIVERIVEAWPEAGDPQGWGGEGRSGRELPDDLIPAGANRGGYFNRGFDTDDSILSR